MASLDRRQRRAGISLKVSFYSADWDKPLGIDLWGCVIVAGDDLTTLRGMIGAGWCQRSWIARLSLLSDVVGSCGLVQLQSCKDAQFCVF
jgi:hypothetical protein